MSCLFDFFRFQREGESIYVFFEFLEAVWKHICDILWLFLDGVQFDFYVFPQIFYDLSDFL